MFPVEVKYRPVKGVRKPNKMFGEDDIDYIDEPAPHSDKMHKGLHT